MKIIDINGNEREAKKAYLDPEFSGYVRVDFKRHHEWYTIKEFLQFNPELKDIVEGAKESPSDLTGIVTKATNLSITDKNKKLKTNEYMGFMVWISRGKGEGQRRSVIKNSKTSIYIDKDWDVKPDHTSQYVVAKEIQEVPAMGNTLAVENVKELEEKAIKMDIKRGIKPQERQYTKDPDEDLEN
ncbi:hypothetical protein ACFL1M_04305 [Patescibacteria group bacterium]